MKKHRLVLQAAALVLVLSLFLGVGRVQASTYPTFSISAVEKDVSVTILTKDMPCLLYTSPSPRDRTRSRMPSSA